MQPSRDRSAMATSEGGIQHNRKLAHAGEGSLMHNGSGDFGMEVLVGWQGRYCKPGNKNHKNLYNPEKKWFELDGRTHRRACRLRGTRLSLIHFTSSCTGKLNFESRTRPQASATSLPHSNLRCNLEKECGLESGGNADDAYPPLTGVSSGEDSRHDWLDFEVGWHLLVLTMDERVAFTMTHCRGAPKFEFSPVDFANSQSWTFRVHR